MNDEALTLAVEAALRHTGYWPSGQISVSVTQGLVVLKGEIEWDFQKRTALYAVQAVSGVVGVVDGIVLRFVQPTLSSACIRRLAQVSHESPSSQL